MRSSIYFPGFEPCHVNWLKFALLYFDTLKPIVPYAADHALTDVFHEVENHTDLIELRRPSFAEGEAATADAIEQVQRILNQPSLYTSVFETGEIDKKWRDPAPTEVIELWSDKFTGEWSDFCDNNKLAKSSKHGVYIAESLSDVYMNVLANCIADTDDIPAISDKAIHRELSFRLRDRSQTAFAKEKRILETDFPILLPKNLSDIDIIDVMRLRNSNGFEPKRRAFHDVLESVTSSVENGNGVEGELAKTLKASYSEFTDTIVQLGAGAVSLGFGMWLVANGTDFDSLDAIRQGLAGTVFSVKGVVSLRNTWTNTRPAKLARQYVADVETLLATQNA